MNMPPRWTPEVILSILKRRWPYCAVPGIALSVILGVAVWGIPFMYLSSSVMLLEPKSVPNDMVRSIVQDESATRLDAIKQSVLGQRNMESVVKRLNLYSTGKDALLTLDERVARLHKDIDVDVISREGQSVTFQIRCYSRNPATASALAQELVRLFMEFDYRMRITTIDKTASFFQGELGKIESRMREAQQRLAEFKSRHNSELPEQLEVNLRTLDQVQQQLKSNGESIDRMEARKLELDRDLAATPRVLPRSAPSHTGVESPEEALLASRRQELLRLRSSLTDLQGKYTQAHPDVIAMTSRVQALEREVRTLSEQIVKAPAVREETVNPVWKELTDQSKQVETELRIRMKEREWLQRQMSNYSSRVANTPLREQEIESTRREYQSLLQDYEAMQKNLSQATLSRNLEGGQNWDQFRIIDVPSVPRTPVSPNRKVLLAALAVFSFALGAGLMFLREFLDSRIHSRDVVRQMSRKPLLAVIAHYTPPSRRPHERLVRLARVGALCGMIAVIVGTGLLAVYRLGLSERMAQFLYKF